MRINDTVMGALIVAMGLAVFLRAMTFPVVPGMQFGPGFFPAIVAGGLMIFGFAITVRGFVRRSAGLVGVVEGSVRRPRPVDYGKVLVVIGVVAGVAVLLDPLGFHLTGILALGVLLLVFGISVGNSLLIAVPAIIAIHLVFYSALGVPLPWGVLTMIAW